MSDYQAKTGVVFDLDGTLLNTLEDLAASTNHTLLHFGYQARTLEEIKGFVGNGIKKLVQRAMPAGILSDDFQHYYNYFRQYYYRNIKNKTKPYPGILKMLKQLKAEGVLLAIVSNKFQEGVDELCRSFFNDLIPIAIGNQKEIMPKPAPDSLYLAIHKLGLDANKDKIFYVGDSDSDILTSRNANIPIIAVTWGFRSKEELIGLNPEYLAKKPEDIVKIIKEM